MSELSVDALRLGFSAGGGRRTEVLRGVSLHLSSGEAVGLVGESGSGKSLLARAILGLLPRHASIGAGRILLDGTDLLAKAAGAHRQVRGSHLGLVLQEPAGALNPVLSVGSQVVEVLRAHHALGRRAAAAAAAELIEMVALARGAEVRAAYPHELSGGQRQRVLLALALAARPQFLLADEPTTALDSTVQLRILGLLDRLRRELTLGLLLITHDLAAVAAICARAYVLYAGEVVEEGPVVDLFATPRHPYTAGLVAAQPRVGQRHPRGGLPTIGGQVPEPSVLPPGCPFHPRCPMVLPRCSVEPAPWVVTGTDQGARCHLLVSAGEP